MAAQYPTAPTVPISDLNARAHRPRSRWRTVLRSAFGLVSALVLLVTGYAWTSLRDLGSGLSTSDVTAGAGADGATDILLVGKDSRTDAQGNPLPDDVLDKLRAGDNDASLTDTLIMLHIPDDRSRAVAYSIPRDSYVPIPGHGEHKINSAFGRAKRQAESRLQGQGVTDSAELERRSSEAGRKLLVQTVGDLTGVGVDHYAEVNLLGFYQITKAVGGVPVCLKDSVDDPYSGAQFAAGPQTVSGSDAMAFVRQRHGLPQGDLDRVKRQQAFLAGLSRSMLSSGTLANPAKLGGLFDSLQQSVVLDQGWNVLTFAQQMQSLTGGNISFDTIPVEDPGYDTPEGEAVQVDPHEVQQTVQRVNKGLPPNPPAPPQLASSTVDIRNSTDTSGLASRVSENLSEDDVRVGDVGNGEAHNTSRVLYAAGNGQAARFVAEQLGGLPVNRKPGMPTGDIRIRLADDYDGPGAQQGFSPSKAVKLDGGLTHRQAPAPAPAPSEDALTAGGVPCVN